MVEDTEIYSKTNRIEVATVLENLEIMEFEIVWKTWKSNRNRGLGLEF